MSAPRPEGPAAQTPPPEQLITEAVTEYFSDPSIDQAETSVGYWVVEEMSVRNLVVIPISAVPRAAADNSMRSASMIRETPDLRHAARALLEALDDQRKRAASSVSPAVALAQSDLRRALSA